MPDDIVHTISHDLYSNTIGHNAKNDWSSFAESFQTNYVMTSFEFLLATRVSQYTVNLFRVRLMAICKENQLNTMVSIYRYKRKPHCLGFPAGLASLERFATKLREEFLFEVILGINFSVSQPQGWELPPREGWHHNKNLQRVSQPQVVLFVSYGDFNAIFVWYGRTPNPHKKICLLM